MSSTKNPARHTAGRAGRYDFGAGLIDFIVFLQSNLNFNPLVRLLGPFERRLWPRHTRRRFGRPLEQIFFLKSSTEEFLLSIRFVF